ncbi:MAG: acyltransferase [Caldilineaceae bacterium]
MKNLLLGLILVAPPMLKRWLLRTFCGATLGRAAQIGWFSAVMGRTVTMGERATIRPFTLIKLDGDVRLGRYSEVSSFTLAYGASDLHLGDHSYVGPQCLLNIDAPLQIGSHSALGPRCMVFTHGSWFPATQGYWNRLAGVTLGDRVWCAAGVFLHPGTMIGDDCFINARTVVTQEIPAGSVAEGNPARVVYPMDRLRRRVTPHMLERTVTQIVTSFVAMVVEGEWEAAVHKGDVAWSFNRNGNSYRLVVVGSAGATPTPDAGRRTLAAVAAPGWRAPAGVLVLDFTSHRTRFEVDPVHTALRIFALRYFGERFEEELP